jgi:predicted negative regulator of RcsB-dependent stress response
VRSSQRRGWVIGVVKAALALGIVLSIVVGVGGYVGLRVYRQQQQHNQIAAASAQFCATISADRSMIAPPDFGWPAVAASIPDSLAAMTAYESKWTKLAQVSPAGVKPDVLAIAAAAKQITDSVAVARTIDDASNIAVMTSAASSSGVPAWYSEYCG